VISRRAAKAEKISLQRGERFARCRARRILFWQATIDYREAATTRRASQWLSSPRSCEQRIAIEHCTRVAVASNRRQALFRRPCAMKSSHHTTNHDGSHPAAANHAAGGHHYAKFALMVVLMFVAMYALMYAMVDRFDNVSNSLNQVYMAALMTAAMVLIELVVMAGMYPDKRLNLILLAVSAVVLVASWFAIRQQAAIGDRQFLRSMIPHHAGAILMCDQAPLDDARIRQLCEQIIRSQQEEIRTMKALLDDTGSE
jgi:uncharacterized protein (DUF305 family)